MKDCHQGCVSPPQSLLSLSSPPLLYSPTLPQPSLTETQQHPPSPQRVSPCYHRIEGKCNSVCCSCHRFDRVAATWCLYLIPVNPTSKHSKFFSGCPLAPRPPRYSFRICSSSPRQPISKSASGEPLASPFIKNPFKSVGNHTIAPTCKCGKVWEGVGWRNPPRFGWSLQV